MCLYPKLIRNPKYRITKKNGGQVPPILDTRVLMIPVGCQKCIECRKQKAREWQLRLLEDVRTNKNGHMVTLTFSNESIKKLSKIVKKEFGKIEGYELDNQIATLAVRRFTERWRKKYKKTIRHWLITELGHTGTEHLHIHGIVWTDETIKEITDKWEYGIVWAGYGGKRTYVNEKTVNYLIKYVTKQDKDHKEYKPKILTSKGIGANYINRTDAEKNKYNEKGTKEYYTTRTGHKMAMPVYWRNKIYTETEREKLWIEKIDKNERWVLGEKIDISKGEERYYKVLEQAREKNKRLGYGTDEKDWNKIKYENERRKLKIEERIIRSRK